MDLHGMLLLANYAHIPTLTTGLQGRQVHSYRLGLKNGVSVPESTSGSFPARCVNPVRTKTTQNRCPPPSSLSPPYLYLWVPSYAIDPTVSDLGLQKKVKNYGGPGKDKSWVGPMAGILRGVRAVESSTIHVDGTGNDSASSSCIISSEGSLLSFQCSYFHTVELITRNTSDI